MNEPRWCPCGWSTDSDRPHDHDRRSREDYERALIAQVDHMVWSECETRGGTDD